MSIAFGRRVLFIDARQDYNGCLTFRLSNLLQGDGWYRDACSLLKTRKIDISLTGSRRVLPAANEGSVLRAKHNGLIFLTDIAGRCIILLLQAHPLMLLHFA